jgi:hypothetical protein
VPLTHDEMNTIVTDYLTGRPQRLHGPEADEFLKTVAPQIDEIERKGGVVDVPPESAGG